MNARAARTGGLLAAAVLALATATGDHDVRGWPPGMRVQSPDEIPQLVRARRGQPVLVALYASWCDDCRAELPLIDDVDARYRARGLSVLAISLDDDPDDFAAMMRRPPRSLELVRAAPVDERVVADSMRRLGATWTGSIPYVALFDVSAGRSRPDSEQAATWPLGYLTMGRSRIASIAVPSCGCVACPGGHSRSSLPALLDVELDVPTSVFVEQSVDISDHYRKDVSAVVRVEQERRPADPP